MTFYSLRLLTFMIGGFISLVWAYNHDGPVEFLCNRYEGLDLDRKSLEDDLDDCTENLRMLGWVIYFPVIFF